SYATPVITDYAFLLPHPVHLYFRNDVTLLILLPPSEGKTAPAPSPDVFETLNLHSLSFPELTAVRKQIIDELIPFAQDPRSTDILKLKGAAALEFPQNAQLLTAPVAPAHQVYTGVLFQAIDFPSLSDQGRRRASSAVAIASALWGFTQPDDHISAYRLTGGTKLPQLGSLNALWRPALEELLAPIVKDQLIVDCRSSTYVSAWKPRREMMGNVVAVRVFTEVDGKRVTVSHQAKKTRGDLTRLLLENQLPLPKSIADLRQTAEQLPGSFAEVTEIKGQPQLDITLNATSSLGA